VAKLNTEIFTSSDKKANEPRALAGAYQPLFLSILSLMGYFGVLNNYEHYSLQIPSKRLGHNIPHSSCNGQNKHSQNFGQPIFLFTPNYLPQKKKDKKKTAQS
jgi:hypothetical protein